MAVGAKDYIDQLLVKKYADEKVDNPQILNSMIDPNKMYATMNDFASAHREMLALREKLKTTCMQATAPFIRYRRSPGNIA